jgi:tRNA U34 2-thiouridine synthase MnmA/TrmU
MDMKIKLESVYKVDKEAQGERIVVGISGGIDSLVMAYLLKIQKYDLFAVTIIPGWDQFTGNKDQLLSCHVSDEKLDYIKEFCNQLKIPLHVIRASSEFQESVVEKWIAAKVTGTFSNACWSCHELRMSLLHQKMIDLDAKALATGHYAKLFHHAADNTYYLHTSNDEENDQSALLSRLPARILSTLKLPLSDLQKKEVLKLAENFGLELKSGKLKIHQCFPSNEQILEYLVEKVPIKMALPGEISNEEGSEIFGKHEGIICHDYGKKFELENLRKGQNLFLGKFSFKDKKMILQEESSFMHEQVQLCDCEFSDGVSWSEPMQAVIQLSSDSFVPCWVYPKALKSVFVKWEGPHKLKGGEIVTIFKKRGKNSKVYLTGKILLLKKTVIDAEKDGENKLPKIDYSRDF